MAKKQTTKTVPVEKTTTYSTRLNEEQRERLEQAASAANMSASRFMRDATLRAASDLHNAAPPFDRSLAKFAKLVANSLLDPTVEVTKQNEYEQTHTVTFRASNGPISLEPSHSEKPEESWRPKELRIEGLTPDDVQNLREMARVCPLSFSQALIAALDGVTEPAPKFVVRSDPDRMLAD
jgi:uncharacterized protein (DUF1778 family)